MDVRKKQDVKVSIIMGIYNPIHEDWLRDSIQSMIDQTFTDWEMILYNDGSDAVYEKRIEKAARMDERIRLVCGDANRGLAYALNQCLRYAEGKYAARMDDDDISKPERLKIQYEWLEGHPEYAWTGSLSELFDNEGVWGIRYVPETPAARDYLFRSPYIHPSVMFRREVLMRAGGYLVSSRTRRCEDYELFMRLQAEGKRGYNVQRPLLAYREDADSYKKRLFRYRMDEMVIRFRGFRKMGVFSAAALPYVVKPILAGAIPGNLHRAIKKRIKR
ncbi:glycosyltransferase [Lachnospiraceae bacterium 50-23]